MPKKNRFVAQGSLLAEITVIAVLTKLVKLITFALRTREIEVGDSNLFFTNGRRTGDIALLLNHLIRLDQHVLWYHKANLLRRF